MTAKKAPGRDETMATLAKLFRIDREQLEAVLARPHGLRGLISGKVHLTSEEDNDRRRKALELGWLIADHLVYDGGQFEDVLYAFDELMDVSKRYRKSDEERTTFIRGVLRVFDEHEKEGRGLRDRLTAEERDRIFYYAARVKKKQTEAAYWISIAVMMVEDRLTADQAREKMYQDLLKEGKTWAAERLRAFQDEVHPLKPDGPPPGTTG
jgi:hypothetical protein